MILLSGHPRKASTCALVLRPVQAGACRLGECSRELTLVELLQLNLALDAQNDTPQGPGFQGHIPH